MTQTIILDLDGPLLDGRDRHYACYQQILTECRFAPVSPDVYWQMKREPMDRERLLAASGAESIQEQFFKAWKERIELSEFLKLDRLQPGVTEKLEQWREQGIQLVLATMRGNQAGLSEQLEHFGLDAYLHQVAVCQHQLGGAGKAGLVRTLLPDLVPANCLWVGDTEVDAEAARAFGCPIWLVSCGVRSELFLAGLVPDFLSHDITSIDLRE